MPSTVILRARLGSMQIDHVVLWVEDPKRALEFYVDAIGLEAVRAQDFEDGRAPFPSVRVNDATIIDLMARALVPFVRKSTAGGEAGVSRWARRRTNPSPLGSSSGGYL
jgi:catechol 2,3-dioxygenase-like lactoylglutathione lyase family enzyme